MKINLTHYVIGGVLAVLFSASAEAQPAGSDATGVSEAARPGSSAMEIRAADRALQRSVRRALAKTRGLDVVNISVRARSGAVVLEGSVPEQSQIDLATHTAQGVAGVDSVKNALVIHVPQ